MSSSIEDLDDINLIAGQWCLEQAIVVTVHD
jgi:hypothetical protein